MLVSQTRIRVRYSETDQMGVVYYANYLVWFEIGRTDFLREIGHSYSALEKSEGLLLPVVEATCRYKAPARYDDDLVLETTLTQLRASVVEFTYRLYRFGVNGSGERQLLAEGKTIHVLVNRDMQKSRLPEDYARALRTALQT